MDTREVPRFNEFRYYLFTRGLKEIEIEFQTAALTANGPFFIGKRSLHHVVALQFHRGVA